MSGGNPSNLAFSWEEPTAEAVSPLGPHLYGTSPGLGLDYLLPHNISMQSFQSPNALESDALDHFQPMPRPYATNWSFFDNYSLSAGLDRETMSDHPESGHRIRINSMASSASSLSYNLPDNTKNGPHGSLYEASEAYVGYNVTYQASPQSNYETTNTLNYDERMTMPPNSILPDQVHPINFGLPSSRPPNGYSEMYLPNFPRDFRPKAPSYCLNRPYKCDHCGSSFSRNHDLKRHSRIHLNVKPFPCTCCDKAFARKDALKRHLLVKGCSQNKQTPPRGSSQSERQKPAQTLITLAKKHPVEQSLSQRSSPTLNQTDGQEVRVTSVPHSSKASKTEANRQFSEIKLHNIKCTMPNFL